MAVLSRRTRIVATIGPASASPKVLLSLIKSGLDVARLNFSHGTHAGHAKLIRLIRSSAKKAGKRVPIIADLQGPKIRLGILPDAGISLKAGQTIVFDPSKTHATEEVLPVGYSSLAKEVKRGDRILIDDGLVETHVLSVTSGRVRAEVTVGGLVTSHKGLNFPDSKLSISSLTKKDREDAVFALKAGVEWFALSFVESAKDIQDLRRLLKRHAVKGARVPKILAKIEKPGAIKAFQEILAEADGIMIARGDLGLEIPAESVPIRQKEMAEACRMAGKPVIVATQMLDSMIRNPRPTRAEVSDVANAVCDHVDAVMLSGETASGKYPKEAVTVMAKTILETEASRFDDLVPEGSNLSSTLARLGREKHVQGIIVPFGIPDAFKIALVARTEVPCFVAVRSEEEARQVSLFWGVHPVVIKKLSAKEDELDLLIRTLKKQRSVKVGMSLAVLEKDGLEVVMVL